MLAVGHAGKRGQRLALGARAHDHDLVLGDAVDVESVHQVGLIDLEVAELARHAGVREHGAPCHHDLAVAGLGGVADLLQAMDVAGEGRDEHAALGVLDDVQQRRTHLRLGFGEPGDGGVGGVGHEQVDALLAELGDGAVIGRHAVDGRLVELEVAGVDDGARGGL